ncbi:hypothetical protein E2C01_099317 [Portunus trituberculatus]|uniref:Uncharacterized protein n=1 Tax=Portunus trituberculatus TaxID=210409 RepID=A0A5B7K9B2_PORTR|nr:hypothetical protein [Portunus trituberculatus]
MFPRVFVSARPEGGGARQVVLRRCNCLVHAPGRPRSSSAPLPDLGLAHPLPKPPTQSPPSPPPMPPTPDPPNTRIPRSALGVLIKSNPSRLAGYHSGGAGHESRRAEAPPPPPFPLTSPPLMSFLVDFRCELR